MKALRILGLAAATVLALLAAAGGRLYALFDGEKIRAEASRAVLEQTRRRLEIAGALELSVWPDVGIRLGRLTLSEPGGKEEFLALDSAHAAMAVMPLLSMAAGRPGALTIPERRRIVAKTDQLMKPCDTRDPKIDAATGKQTELPDALMAALAA